MRAARAAAAPGRQRPPPQTRRLPQGVRLSHASAWTAPVGSARQRDARISGCGRAHASCCWRAAACAWLRPARGCWPRLLALVTDLLVHGTEANLDLARNAVLAVWCLQQRTNRTTVNSPCCVPRVPRCTADAAASGSCMQPATSRTERLRFMCLKPRRVREPCRVSDWLPLLMAVRCAAAAAASAAASAAGGGGVGGASAMAPPRAQGRLSQRVAAAPTPAGAALGWDAVAPYTSRIQPLEASNRLLALHR